MKDTDKLVEEFRRYASEKLKVHQMELATRYENMEIDDDTIRQAYEEHKKIFQQELKDKIGLQLADNDPWLKEELSGIGDDYINQLLQHK